MRPVCRDRAYPWKNVHNYIIIIRRWQAFLRLVLDGRYQRVRDVRNVVLGQGVRGGRLDRVASGRRRRLQQLGHETDVRDGQPERFDPRQAFLVRECGHFAPELVKRLV